MSPVTQVLVKGEQLAQLVAVVDILAGRDLVGDFLSFAKGSLAIYAIDGSFRHAGRGEVECYDSFCL